MGVPAGKETATCRHSRFLPPRVPCARRQFGQAHHRPATILCSDGKKNCYHHGPCSQHACGWHMHAWSGTVDVCAPHLASHKTRVCVIEKRVKTPCFLDQGFVLENQMGPGTPSAEWRRGCSNCTPKRVHEFSPGQTLHVRVAEVSMCWNAFMAMDETGHVHVHGHSSNQRTCTWSHLQT